MNSGVDTSASGIGDGRFEGVSPVFTEVQLISEGDINILGKGKRYGRWWLLKGLQPDLSELTQYVEMLHKEFELLMKAQHPGIVQTVGLEEVDGLGECIVMEYVEGTTLKEVMEQGLSSRTAARLMDELTDAVAYIHSLGIVHRDLKPSNIIVTRGGHVKLIDFGLADTHAHAFLKQSAGTKRYMSPEQAAGGKPDARNDIYSLGVIMQGMPLPWAYRRSIARCLCPIERRWSSIEALKGSIASNRLWMQRAAYGIIAAVMLAILGMGGYMMQNRMGHTRIIVQTQEVDSTNAVAIDSLRRQLKERDREIAALNQDMAQNMQRMSDSMKHAMTTAVKEEAMLNDHMKRAIELGMNRLNEAIGESGVEMILDTLSRWQEPWSREVPRRIVRVNTDVNNYIAGLNNTYTQREVQTVRDTIMSSLTKWNERMARKMKVLAKKE